jgi:hypothetical protein
MQLSILIYLDNFTIFNRFFQKIIGYFYDKSYIYQNSHHLFRRIFVYLLLLVRGVMAMKEKVSMITLKKAYFFLYLVLYVLLKNKPE